MKDLTRDELEHKMNLLWEAKEHLWQTINLIEEAVADTRNESFANAYIIPHLKTWAGEGNPMDKDIPSYIEDLEEERLYLPKE